MSSRDRSSAGKTGPKDGSAAYAEPKGRLRPAIAARGLSLCLIFPLVEVATAAERPRVPQSVAASDVLAAEEHHPVDRPLSAAMSQALVRRGNLHSRVINGRMLWWLDSELPPNGRQDPSDLIFETRLAAGRQQPFVTCSTCHDPVPVRAGAALRLANRADALCLACHQR